MSDCNIDLGILFDFNIDQGILFDCNLDLGILFDYAMLGYCMLYHVGILSDNAVLGILSSSNILGCCLTVT